MSQEGIPEILARDDAELLCSCKELPFDILSLVINSIAHKCFMKLRDSEDFKKHVRNITHINPECVTSKMLQDFLGCELGENENWVDLAIELKSPELINKLGDKATRRIIQEDDAELFALIENQNQYTEEVFRRNKYSIATSLKDERVTKIAAKDLKKGRFIETGKYVVIEYGAKIIPYGAFNNVYQSDMDRDESPEYIIIPSSVTQIGQEAFSGCFSLKSITIPSSVTRIRDCTFSKCSSLESVTIPLGVKRIDSEAFSEGLILKVAKQKLDIPSTSKQMCKL